MARILQSVRMAFKKLRNPLLRPKRLSCDRCQKVWGKRALVTLHSCPECHGPLRLKSYSPAPKVLLGLALIAGGFLTLLWTRSPIAWVGGILWGALMIGQALWRWVRVLSIDLRQQKPAEGRSDAGQRTERIPDRHSDPRFLEVTCGSCFGKVYFRKGLGVVRQQCPHCSKWLNVQTSR